VQKIVYAAIMGLALLLTACLPATSSPAQRASTPTGGQTWMESNGGGVGTKWTVQAVGYDLYGVTYANGRFVAVGDKGAIFTSPDGINWTEHSLDSDTPTLYAVTYGNDRFVAVGSSNAIFTSLDGVAWKKEYELRAFSVMVSSWQWGV